MAKALSSHHAVYVGSFDPLTLGHVDIIRRGATIFDRLTVGIGINPEKRPLFTPEERLSLMITVLKPLKNVEVRCFEGLTVEFIRQCGARVLLRGVRTLSDIETEFTMTLANRALDPDIDTLFLMASERYTHVSSTLIKQIAQLAVGSASGKLNDFVPAEVIEPLLRKYKRTDTTSTRLRAKKPPIQS
jgi:pantetheine-phosphate adenylyltransferase